MKIFCVRHGETDWNKMGRIQGHLDIPLNTTGKHQADFIGTQLQKNSIDLIISSDLVRAYETAKIISNLNRIPIITDIRLRERHYGQWQTLTWSEVHEQNPNIKKKWQEKPLDSKPPNGESIQELYQRVSEFFNNLLMRKEDNVLLVAHNSPIRILICLALNLALEDIHTLHHLSNTEILQFTIKDGNLSIDERELLKLKQNRKKLDHHEKII